MKKLLLLSLLLIVVLLYPVLLLIRSTTPQLSFAQPVMAVGSESPIPIRIANANGVRRLSAYIEQDGQRHQVFESSQPAIRWTWKRKMETAQEPVIKAGKKQAPGLKEGKAKLIIEAVSNDLRAATSSISAEVEINTRPLSIVADGLQHYINQGGSELVTFKVDGYWTEAGVRVGKYTFRSFELPGKPGERFSLFAFPWDMPADTVPVVYASNPTGAEVTGKFWYKLFPKPFRKRDLDLPDSFLAKVTSELDPGGSGDLVPRFLKINGEMRRANNAVLADLRKQTAEKILWQGPFVQLSNSKVESQFADQRSYLYQGKKIDQQMHLGFDLSVVKNVPVAASNSGKVLHAAPLGIYGNCVVVDHGFGLQSIYAHLSSFDVKVGDSVTKGQTVGKSGATGLAGGDHLHYSMQVDGIQVNPVEWWDEHWIKDRITSKVPAS